MQNVLTEDQISVLFKKIHDTQYLYGLLSTSENGTSGYTSCELKKMADKENKELVEHLLYLTNELKG